MKKYSKKMRHLLWFAAAILLTLYLFWGHKYQLVYNEGESMHPTHEDGDWVIVEKRGSMDKGWVPDKFDVVLVRFNGETLCKRVVGVPGDKIKVEDGYIYLNGNRLEDPFGSGRICFTLTDEDGEDLHYWGTRDKVVRYLESAEEAVPKGFVWVIGDNRSVSWFGLIPIKEIKSLVVL